LTGFLVAIIVLCKINLGVFAVLGIALAFDASASKYANAKNFSATIVDRKLAR
jgi:hypothetical protein